jgi:hypothetical protein
METIGSILLLAVCGSAFLWQFKDQDKLSFFDKFLHMMFLKVFDVVYVACYNQLMFIEVDDSDDEDTPLIGE